MREIANALSCLYIHIPTRTYIMTLTYTILIHTSKRSKEPKDKENERKEGKKEGMREGRKERKLKWKGHIFTYKIKMQYRKLTMKF